MDGESMERPRKKELQVYTRQNNVPQASPSDPIFPRPKPCISSNDNVPPQPTLPRNDEIDLNIGMDDILEKVNIHALLIKIINIPSMRNKVERFLKVQGEPGDPPILLQRNHFRQTNEEYTPFFISLELNNMCLNNCMHDSRASTKVMNYKVMKQLGLEIKIPYGNVCGIYSKSIGVYGLIEDMEVCLARYLEIVIAMDVVVLDVLDTWGMLLSRKWPTTLGGTLQMDLSYATIPIGYDALSILYNQPKKRTHVEDLESDFEFDTSLEEDDYEELLILILTLYDLPFVQEVDITYAVCPKREDYQRQLDKYKDKDLGSIIILKGGSETKLHEDDRINISLIMSCYSASCRLVKAPPNHKSSATTWESYTHCHLDVGHTLQGRLSHSR
jgi:hypothetical protein